MADTFRSAVIGSDEVTVTYQRPHRLSDHWRGPQTYRVTMTREEWDALPQNKPSWQQRDRDRLVAVLHQLDKLHQPYLGGEFGHRRDGERFWCQSCRSPYPCPSAKLLLSYGNGEDVEDWQAVTLKAAEERTRG